MIFSRCVSAVPRCAILVMAVLWVSAFPHAADAETGAEAWLRYSDLSPAPAENYRSLPEKIVLLGDRPVLKTAQRELVQGVSQMVGKTLLAGVASSPRNAIVLGTLTDLRALIPSLRPREELRADSFWLKIASIRGSKCVIITAPTDGGVLYGVFALLSKIARGESLALIDEVQQPYAPVRWVNQWDNLDGRIERGYRGPSIFFSDGKVRADLTRAGQYARLLASIGINGKERRIFGQNLVSKSLQLKFANDSFLKQADEVSAGRYPISRPDFFRDGAPAD